MAPAEVSGKLNTEVVVEFLQSKPLVAAIGGQEAPKLEEVQEKPLDTMLEKTAPGKEDKETESDDEIIFLEPIENTNETDVIVLVSEDEDEEPSEPEKETVESFEKEPHGILSTDLKRSHDHVESSPVQEKEEIANKKLKTNDSDSNSSIETLHIDLDAKDEAALEEKESKLDLKPEPEIKTDVKEFLKNFRRSFDTLTRDDLEQLVLQKVTEAVQIKREFADIRTQLDRYETTLATYRRKIAEVSKQVLDLETVHKRVLMELESKNSHFKAPVKKETRTIGQQVGIPFSVMKVMVAGQDQSLAAGSMLATPSGTPATPITLPMPSTIFHRSYEQQQRPNSALLIDLTEESDEEEEAAAGLSGKAEQVTNNAVKWNDQAPAASGASLGGSGERGGGKVVRASLMPLAPVHLRQICRGQPNSLAIYRASYDSYDSGSSKHDNSFPDADSDYSCSSSPSPSPAPAEN